MANVLFTDTAGNNPANFGQSVARVSDKNLDLRPGLQASSSLRPLAVRTPIGEISLRNRLRSSANLGDTDFWNLRSTVSASQDGDGWVITEGARSSSNFYTIWHETVTAPSGTSPRLRSIVVEDISARYIYLGGSTSSGSIDGGAETVAVVYDLQEASVVSSNASAAGVIDLGNGRYQLWSRDDASAAGGTRRTFAFGFAAPNGSFNDTVNGYASGDGGRQFRFIAAQAEIAQSPTPVQVVGSTTSDFAEPGVPSLPCLRFDLSDDRIEHTFPNGFQGDVMIFGRNGSWVEKGVTIAPGGRMDIGPNAVASGRRGTLDMLGDIVGWLPVGRNVTAQERQYMTDYFKERGAKGLLVPGPEALTNWDFTDGLNGWDITGDWTASSNAARIDRSADDRTLQQSNSLIPGKGYLAEYIVRGVSGTGTFIFSLTNPNGYGTIMSDIIVNEDSSYPVIARNVFFAGSPAIRTSFGRSGTGTSRAFVESISARQLVPEEEL